jgi:glycosyltransferase involved in cell wall biosynthesis
MIVSIVIPTYRRPRLLAQAVRSCLNQNHIDSSDYEIVIVDNCPSKSSQCIAEDLMRDQPTITYVNEPRRGVAFARNTGIVAARGEYIAFLDDDESATSIWLHELLKHGLQGAAAVFGPIREIIDDALKHKRDLLDFSIVSRFFDRPDGDDISDRLYDLGTGNSLFSKRQCFGAQNRFDERYNFVGGEDIEFLSRLRRRKIQFIWAANAWVEEGVPQERLTARYLMKRRFYAGQVRTIVESKNRRFGFVHVLLWMAVGGTQILYYSVGYLIALIRGRDTTNYAARIGGGAGKLLFFYRPNTYLS